MLKQFIVTIFLTISLPLWGQIIDSEPQQEDLKNSFIIAEKKGYAITALAKFELTARVLGVESYSRGKESDLSPYDFALGWKNMSSEKFLSKIKIRQSNRFYFWYTEVPETYSQKNKIITQSANMHLIPATKEVKHPALKDEASSVAYVRIKR